MDANLTKLELHQILEKGKVPEYGEIHEFLNRYYTEPHLQKDPKLQQIHQALTMHASVCSFCGVGCPYTVYKTPKGFEKLLPLSSLGLCVKGSSSLLSGGHKQRDTRLEKKKLPSDRITSPMIRGHNGKLQKVSWERALQRAAWLFLHIREWVGPDGLAIYGNGQKTAEAIFMASLYRLVFKLPTIGANSEHCLASAGAAHSLNFGNEASFTWREFEELEFADVIILHGTNPVITFPQAHEKVKRNEHAIKVVIDPIASDTVTDLVAHDSRTIHIRFEQGGDVLFNLAVARAIIDQGWDNQAYLQQHVDQDSQDAFKKLCLEDRCTPKAVAKQIVLDGDDPKVLEKTILNYAALIAKPKANGERPRPAFISSMGINQSTGSYGFSTNLNLLLLTGNVGRKGAGSLRIAGQSNATSELMLGFNSRKLLFNLNPLDASHRQQLADVLDIPVKNIADKYGTPVSKMADDDLLYCFIFIGTQFTRNMPRLGHWMRRLGRSFNIVIDSFMPEGVEEYADVVFPALTYTERTGVIQRGDRSLQLQQGISEPPEMAWADEKILAKLAMTIAERLKNPHTAQLNDLDAKEVAKAFGRYLDKDGDLDSAIVFDHMVDISRKLNVYNRLEDSEGNPISHEMLRKHAGRGVQWQGNNRYQENDGKFPNLGFEDRTKAKLVCPPERFLQRLVNKGNENLRSLISGRGRPGMKRKHYIARYNSGIKTKVLTGEEATGYWIEVNPDYARDRNFNDGQAVRITSHHGTIIGRISLNKNVPKEFPFLDFVPGEANRLTNYIEADKFTNQSLIKRTPIRMEALTENEQRLWDNPDMLAFSKAIAVINKHCKKIYPTEEALLAFLKREENTPDWLPWNILSNPQHESEYKLAHALGAIAAFLQQYMNNNTYKQQAAPALFGLSEKAKNRFLETFILIIRKLDYTTALLPVLSDIVGTIPLIDKNGKIEYANLKEAHQAAVLELKEEVVAIQLFLAIKKGLDLLFGKGAIIPRESLALVSGITIPCASDVPAYFMGVSPSDIELGRLVHSRSAGLNGIVVVDRKNNRAVKIDTITGILPKSQELKRLKSKVIGQKRSATPEQHNRFFDLLEELILNFVKVGDDNFEVTEVATLPWAEYIDKLSFVPASPSKFRIFLASVPLSSDLIHGLVGLDILKKEKEADFIESLLTTAVEEDQQALLNKGSSFSQILENQAMSTQEKVHEVIESYIGPILANDGGKINFLGYDDQDGSVSVRFVGSCANCPCSMLSMETIVIPPLLKIPGVRQVIHRGEFKEKELMNP